MVLKITTLWYSKGSFTVNAQLLNREAAADVSSRVQILVAVIEIRFTTKFYTQSTFYFIHINDVVPVPQNSSRVLYADYISLFSSVSRLRDLEKSANERFISL